MSYKNGMCSDVVCKFKLKRATSRNKAGECSITTECAKSFFNKYKVTTCECGMGEKVICQSQCETDKIIREVRFKGSVSK